MEEDGDVCEISSPPRGVEPPYAVAHIFLNTVYFSVIDLYSAFFSCIKQLVFVHFNMGRRKAMYLDL
jgi:hypothetical protein